MSKAKNEKLVVVAAVAVIAVAVVAVAYGFMQSTQPQYYGTDYQRAISAQGSDPCATPAGYTDESWREHMSHHPSQYTECLG